MLDIKNDKRQKTIATGDPPGPKEKGEKVKEKSLNWEEMSRK